MRRLSVSGLVGVGGLALLGLAGFTPLSDMLAALIQTPEHLQPADAIVVLGNGVSRDGSLSDGSLRRAIHGISLHRSGLAPLLVLSGTAAQDGPPEAEVRARLAVDFGIPREAILTIADARTTREEADRVATLLRPRGARDILLVTDSMHIARAQLAFARHGFSVAAAPTGFSHSADTPGGRLALMRSVVQELLARLYYRM